MITKLFIKWKMESNTNVSLKSLIHTILLNDDTNIIADSVLLNYLKQHPTLITKYMNENGIYHVYYRTRDEATDPGNRRSPFVILLKSFASEKEAKEWILQYGRDIVEEQEDNHGRPIVLFIQHNTNEDYETGYEPTNPHYISSHKYPVYAFSNKVYKMLLTEHIYLLGDDNYSNYGNYNSIPYWINHVTMKKLIQGVREKDIKQIKQAYMRVDDKTKIIYMNDIDAYKNNPQKYIDEYTKR